MQPLEMKLDENIDLEKIQGKLEEILKPLSNQVRLKLLFLIAGEPKTYSDLLKATGLESGSFYWHIRKMEALVEQTYDRKYVLSKLGEQAVRLLLADELEAQPTYPNFIRKAVTAYDRINQAPLWLLIQQTVIILLLTSALYTTAGLMQFGITIRISEGNDYLAAIGSIIISILVINLVAMGLFIIYWKKIKEGRWLPPKVLADALLKSFIALLPVLLSGIVLGLMVVAQFPVEVITSEIFQALLAFVSTLFAIFSLSVFFIQYFSLELREAMILASLALYPIVFFGIFAL